MAEPAAGTGPAFTTPFADEQTISAMAKAAEDCHRCDLYRHAENLVFGEGPTDARLMIVGEQPGDKEDLAARPFVGPAGRVLDECLHEAGIDRGDCYLTNAVKHFKFTPRGKRRMHSRPNAGEVRACAWWLHGEISVLEPRLVLAMGATAIGSLLGRRYKVLRDRGSLVRPEGEVPVLITIHPSFLLRTRDRAGIEKNRGLFIDDLRKARDFIADGRDAAARSD